MSTNRTRRPGRLLLSASLGMALLPAAAPPGRAESANRIVARVNDRIATLYDYDVRYADAMRRYRTNLAVLAASGPRRNPAELLQSPRASEAPDRLEAIFDPTSGPLVSPSYSVRTPETPNRFGLRFLGRDASDPRARVIRGTDPTGNLAAAMETCRMMQDALPAEDM